MSPLKCDRISPGLSFDVASTSVVQLTLVIVGKSVCYCECLYHPNCMLLCKSKGEYICNHQQTIQKKGVMNAINNMK